MTLIPIKELEEASTENFTFWFNDGDIYNVIIEEHAKYWCKNGERHRINGPAIEHSNGDKYWFKNGNLHREDGPAIEYSNGNKSWYLEGIYYIL